MVASEESSRGIDMVAWEVGRGGRVAWLTGTGGGRVGSWMGARVEREGSSRVDMTGRFSEADADLRVVFSFRNWDSVPGSMAQ